MSVQLPPCGKLVPESLLPETIVFLGAAMWHHRCSQLTSSLESSIARHTVADIGIDEDLHSPVYGTVQLGRHE